MFFVFGIIYFEYLSFFDQERETWDVCVVQQCYPLQIGLYLQVKETFVSFYVH